MQQKVALSSANYTGEETLELRRAAFCSWAKVVRATKGAAGLMVRQMLLSAVKIVLPTGVLLATLLGASEPVRAEDGVGTPPRLRLLTTQQYINTIQNFFGPDIKIDVKFAPLARTDGLLMAGSSIAGVSDAQVESYQKVANIVAAQVLAPGRRDILVPCKPKLADAADKACAEKFLGDVTSYFYRAPLSEARLTELVDQADDAASRTKDFYAGLQLTLEGVLMSPNVLFVAETDEPDPNRPGGRRLDAYSLASRLSLFLWNSAPDRTLLKAADSGELNTPRGRERMVDMMLASPRLEAGVRSFFDDMFGFDDFDTLAKDATIYPYFLAEASGDAREQTLRTVVAQLLTKNGDYRDLFTTRDTFVSPSLAIIYGVPASPGWHEIEFPPEAHRDGILTQVSFLALHSHPGRSSATRRGKALRELFLCQNVPAPPPNVDFTLVNNPNSTYKTARERLDAHRQNPVCAGCHKIMDPMGLALESFDGAGRFRADENGTPIDTTGSLDGKSFKDVEGLSVALHDNPLLPACLVKRAVEYASGGKITPNAKPALDQLNKDFASSRYRLRALLKAIAMSDEFSTVEEAAPKQAQPPTAGGTRSSNNISSNP